MKTLILNIVRGFKAWAARRRYERCVKQAAKIIADTKQEWPGCEGAMMTDVWPPTSGISTGFLVKGKTTIQWGTEGLLSTPHPTSGFYQVLRCTERQIFDRSKLPQGSGLTTSDVFVTDGVTWDITVRDDSNMTPPALNTTVSIVDGAGYLGTVGQVYTARIVDPNWEGTLREAATRQLVCDNLILIDSQTGAAQTTR